MPKTMCRLALWMMLVMMPATAARAQTDRPSDHLLARPDLQALVDLQVERDARALIERLGDPDPAGCG